MNTFDIEYNKQARELKNYYQTFLLADLIYLNYTFSNKEYNHINGNQVWEESMTKFKITEKGKNKIIMDAMQLLHIKYNVALESDVIKQFFELNIKR